MPAAEQTLALGVIGNGSFNALIDGRACVVWCCLPRPESDPVLNAIGIAVRRHRSGQRRAVGNFPQTDAMVGIINGATRLSRRWDTVL